ncbi:hypothetical protein C0J52_24355 [Blattella germanica]|nr:hypothetical protein C0J52_24355 [Blattella germanica]
MVLHKKLKYKLISENWLMSVSVSNFFLVLIVLTPSPSTNCPAECVCTKTDVDCASRNISELTNSTFVNDLGVKKINLSCNHLQILPQRIFWKLKHLKELNLSRNHLASLYQGTFNNSNRLNVIDLGYNKLQSIEPTLFSSTTSLKIIMLQGNLLELLNITVFRGLKSLGTLDISGNQIANLQDYLFSDLKKLMNLQVDTNNLTVLSSAVFRKLIKLEKRQQTFIPLIEMKCNTSAAMRHCTGYGSKEHASNASNKCSNGILRDNSKDKSEGERVLDQLPCQQRKNAWNKCVKASNRKSAAYENCARVSGSVKKETRIKGPALVISSDQYEEVKDKLCPIQDYVSSPNGFDDSNSNNVYLKSNV